MSMLVDSRNGAEILPLDRGLTFGWRNRRIWFQIAVFFSVIDGLIGAFIASTESSSIQFLMFVPAALTHCWFISGVVNVTILRMRGQLVDLSFARVMQPVLGAFAIVPKVLFATMLIFVVFGMGFPISPVSFPLWFLGVLFSWGPLFVAADASVPEEKKKQHKLADDEVPLFGGVLDDDDGDDTTSVPVNNYFVGRPVWDLGINRSVRFSLSQMPLTLYLVWLVILAVTLPLSLVSGTFGLEEGSLGVVVHAVLEPFALAFVLGSLTSALVFGLPEESRDELGISESAMEELQASEDRGPVFQLQGRLFSNLGLFALSMLSIAGVVSYLVSVTAVPSTATISLLRTEQVGSDVRMTVSVRDSSERLNWLEPQMFVIAKADPVKQGASGSKTADSTGANFQEHSTPSESAWGEFGSAQLVPLFEIVRPNGVALFDDNNSVVSFDDFSRAQGGIRLVLTFNNLTEKNLEGRSLVYQRIVGFGSVVASSLKILPDKSI